MIEYNNAFLFKTINLLLKNNTGILIYDEQIPYLIYKKNNKLCIDSIEKNDIRLSTMFLEGQIFDILE